jgi:uncharacterized protein YkwD
MDTRIRIGFGLLILGLIDLAPRPALAGERSARRTRSTQETVTLSDVPDGTHQLLGLVNRERAAVGAPPIALRDDLMAVAVRFSRQMAAERNLAHNLDFLSPASAARLGAGLLGENVALEPTVETAHARLMESPGHRANILEPSFRFAGIAVVRAGNGSLFITEDFLAPSSPAAKSPLPVPAAKPPQRPQRPARSSRATRQPLVPPPTPTTTTSASAPPAATPPVATGQPTVPAPAAVSDLLPVLLAKAGVGGEAQPGKASTGGGSHDLASFQFLVLGSTLALTIRRVR